MQQILISPAIANQLHASNKQRKRTIESICMPLYTVLIREPKRDINIFHHLFYAFRPSLHFAAFAAAACIFRVRAIFPINSSESCAIMLV